MPLPNALLHLHGNSVTLKKRDMCSTLIRYNVNKLFYSTSFFQINRTQSEGAEKNNNKSCTKTRDTNHVSVISLPQDTIDANIKYNLANQELHRIRKADCFEDFCYLVQFYNLNNSTTCESDYVHYIYNELYVKPVANLQEYIKAHMTETDKIIEQLKNIKLVFQSRVGSTPEITVDDWSSDVDFSQNEDLMRNECLTKEENLQFLNIPKIMSTSDVSCECRPP